MAAPVNIERALALEAAELTSCDPETSLVLCDTYLYEAEPHEAALGSLFLVVETSNVPALTGGAEAEAGPRAVMDAIARALRDEHYRDPDRPLRESFEAALGAANTALAAFAKRGEISWLENLHAAAGTFQGTDLHASRVGGAEILLARKGGLTDVGEGLSESKVRHPQHAFTTIASGALRESDAVVLATPSFTHLVPRERLGAFLTGKLPREAVTYIRDLLAEASDLPAFAALFLRAAKAPLTLPAPERAPLRDVLGRPTPPPSVLPRSMARARPLGIRLHPSRGQRLLGVIRRGCTLLAHLTRTQLLPATRAAARTAARAAQSTAARTRQVARERLATRDTARTAADTGAAGRPAAVPAAKQVVAGVQKFPETVTSTIRHWPRSTKAFAALTLILALLFLGSTVLLKRKRAEEAAIRAASERLQEARVKRDAADAALIYENTSEAAKLLREARAAAGAVAATPYYQDDVRALLAALQATEDTAERIVRVPEPARAGDFAAVLPSGSLRGLAAIGAQLYAVSPETNAILRLNTENGEASVVSQTSQGIGYFRAAHALPADNMLLFVTDSPGLALFDAAKGDLTKQELQGLPEGTRDIRALATFGSRLYLLLPEHRQIYGFSKTLAGYQGGAPWVQDEGIPVADGVSMGVDGYIYLLTNDGKIVKLLKGAPVDFAQAELTTPLAGATRLFVTDTLKYLYVLDPPNKRVVVLDTTGQLSRQFVLPNAVDLRDLTVAGKDETLYVLDGTAVYRVALK